jgi:hypothetical protein
MTPEWRLKNEASAHAYSAIQSSAALAAFGGRGSEGPLELGCCVEGLGPRTSMERDAKYMTQ